MNELERIQAEIDAVGFAKIEGTESLADLGFTEVEGEPGYWKSPEGAYFSTVNDDTELTLIADSEQAWRDYLKH